MKKQKTLNLLIFLLLLTVLYPLFFFNDIQNYLSVRCDQVEEPFLKKFCYVSKFEINYKSCDNFEYKKDNDACTFAAYRVLEKSKQIDYWPSVLRWFLPPIFLILLVIRFKRYRLRKKTTLLRKKLEFEKKNKL